MTPRYEYRVVPAPRKAPRSFGLKGLDARHAAAIETVINDLAAEGWEYFRADAMPRPGGDGFLGRGNGLTSLLVFRRAVGEAAVAAPEPPGEAEPQTATARAPGLFAPRQSAEPEDDHETRYDRALRAVKGPSALRRRQE